MCKRPLSNERSLVTGELTDRLERSCNSERRDGRTHFTKRERCGTAAKFFEERR
jgi:hypothetical protein